MELTEVCLIVQFVLKGKLYTESLSVTHHLFGRMATDLGRTEPENWCKGNMSRDCRHKDIHINVNNNPRGTLAMEGFSSKGLERQYCERQSASVSSHL